MGACHAKSKHIPTTKLRGQITPQTISPPQTEQKQKPVDSSELDISGDTALAADNDAINLNISPSLIIYFSSFYKKRMTALKSSETMLGNSINQGPFIKKLAELNNITEETAQIWVSAYIDYMIVMAWFYFAIEEKEMYAPFSIQQTQRLHISYCEDYKKFCNILTDNKGLIHYSPRKIVLESEQIDQIESSYDELRESIIIYIYDNNLTYDAKSRLKEHLSEIWENFYDTFIKNEFSFYLSANNNNSTTAAIKKVISSISTHNHNFSMSTEAITLLRKGLNLPIDFNENKSLRSLDISPLLATSPQVSNEEKSVAKIVDEIKLPFNFARLLSWEQVISLDEAREWIVEYKKFIFLSLLKKSPTSIPSQNIMQVWLLHMSFTRSYQKFIEEQIIKNNLRLSIKERIFETEDSTMTLYQTYFGKSNNSLWSRISSEDRVCVSFIDSIIKRQEELLNIKLSYTLTDESSSQSSIDLKSASLTPSNRN